MSEEKVANVDLHCVAVATPTDDAADPDPGIVAALIGDDQHVKPVSRCILDEKGIRGKAGETAVLFFVNGVQWQTDTKARVTGGCYVTRTAGMLMMLEITKEDEKWNVVGRVAGVS